MARSAIKRVTTTAGLMATGAATFIIVGIDHIIRNTGKPPGKPTSKHCERCSY